MTFGIVASGGPSLDALEQMATSHGSASDEPVLELQGVWKRYHHTDVLKGVDLKVRRGEKVCVIGPSGGGKSTLLRCCNLLELPSRGNVRFLGQPLWAADSGHRSGRSAEVSAARKRIGMVFQQFDLFPHMTARQNVTFGPVHALGTSKDDAMRTADRLLTDMGLEQFRDSYPRHLSGGQQQRVAIARALAMRPELMLFDEPTSALDPEMVGEVLSLMVKLADAGMTMVIVTHEMRFARRIADRVVVLDGGELIESGPPSVIFEQPTHERTRQFLTAVLNPFAADSPHRVSAP